MLNDGPMGFQIYFWGDFPRDGGYASEKTCLLDGPVNPMIWKLTPNRCFRKRPPAIVKKHTVFLPRSICCFLFS